ncbi:hypothetical protein KC318_g3602 [Hortaea werneckii]|uniref:Amine oxidase domain-containing protein n=1 Tax=Hortaea werneckii TaxID=91943 RepID=A0A3M7A991_HORWE|nr:hypothetical protein KC334_g2480 [Hortaea werneckii]KAI7021785.1 hypothetical protein KC355_g2272 [Hortaea werneckii]KAI7671238.1 hypothetical protein KC318_g3602 [Hortaea werneckii]RMY24007.1 hypothetical protein D0867_01666 [Hortaea werneckii]RMY41129.1 hypothetical protein D0866_00809 [Hortaea werneckii]
MASQAPNHGGRHYSTIVIGAGMSGLACASRLQHPSHQKPNSLLVLEARDRIGGRIEAVHVSGCRLDTGANWIHGTGTKEMPNPLVEILPHKRMRPLDGAVAFKAPRIDGVAGESHEREDGWVEIDGAVKSRSTPPSKDERGSGESRTIPAASTSILMGSVWGMLGSLHDEAASAPDNDAKKTTVLNAIRRNEVFRSAFAELPPELHPTLSGMPQFIENMEAAPLAAQSAEHDKGRAGLSLAEYAIDDFDGDQVFLQDGYLSLIDEVAKALREPDLTKTGAEVQRIRWDRAPVVVETGGSTFTADRVVCSLPLGVLQHHSRRHQKANTPPVFEPLLPKGKQDALDSLGYGTLDKIFLVYDHAWWSEEPYLSRYQKGVVKRSTGEQKDEDARPDSFMGFSSELPGISIHPENETSPGARLLSCLNLDSLTNFPVLSAFVSCSNATHIESLSDQEAGAIVHRALASWLGLEPPLPAAVHVTRWASDPFSRGSYSHMLTGLSDHKHREEFQRPVRGSNGGELRFAGEHTSSDHFATVHGALLSGWREADGILAELGDDVGPT